MNSYILLLLLALVATIQTIPAIDDDNNNNNNNNDNDDGNNNNNSSEYDENKSLLMNDDFQDDQYQKAKAIRHLHRIIDGTIQRIKSANIIYKQRLRDDQCVVEYDGKYLTENSVLQIRKKLYRVENCLLERVFHACGPNLLLMLNVVCRVVERQPTTTQSPIVRRTTVAQTFMQRVYPRAYKTPRVITESCCENLCTISELTRYCHR